MNHPAGSTGIVGRYEVCEIRKRFEAVGHLRAAALAEKTWTCYSRAMSAFLAWLECCARTPSYSVSLDLFLVQYCEVQYDDNPKRGSRQHCVNAMSALEFTCAELAGRLVHTRQALRGWSRLSPARSPAPLSAEMVTAMAGFFYGTCLLYTSPSPRDKRQSRMPSSA